MPRSFFIFLFLVLTTLPGVTTAQSVQDEYLNEDIEIREFDKERWKSLSEDIDYSGDGGREEEFEEGEGDEDGDEAPRTKRRSSSSSGKTGASGFAEIIKYVVIIGAIVLAIFLLIKLLGRDGPRNKKINPVTEMELEEIEDDLENADLNDPIQRAIASGNYTLAIRLYYLSLLKELAVKKIIRWKKDKTNGEYMRELAGSPISDMFRDVTLVFERVWYGKVELTKEDFFEIEKEFKNAIAVAEKQQPKEQ